MEFSVKASVDTTQGTVGDLFKLGLTVEIDTSLQLAAPQIEKSFGDFQIISISDPSVSDSGNIRNYSWALNIAAYKTGELNVPEVEFTALDKGGSEYHASTDSITVSIVSVLPTTTGDSLAIKDIKPIYEFPLSYWYYIIIGVLILIIAGSIYYYMIYRKRKKGLILKPEKPAEPPWVTALRMLEFIKDARYLEKGEFRQFYFKLSETAKFYVDKRFNIPAIERTTTEVKETYNKLNPAEIDEEFISFLEYSDLVKFAKYSSTLSEGNKWFDYMDEIVRKSKPGSLIEEPIEVNETVK
ncbi:MAG: protein BatD [candidate division Zixibacteria bacterium]|nr:protein BatD [candidate division Zixibacteria bacterium]